MLDLLAANSHLCLGVSSIVAIGIFSGSGQDYLVEVHSVSTEKNATAALASLGKGNWGGIDCCLTCLCQAMQGVRK